MSFLSNVDTNLEAYKLVHDPTKLLYLLFTKYGDIEEEYIFLIINQLVENKFTHLNSIFKENIFHNDIREFLRRIYKKKETKDRIPKLYDYYKNYYKYYCRPFFLNFYSNNVLHQYYNIKAEIYYKKNYSYNEEKKESENTINTNTISSFDNDTDNKIIFDKRNKYIIDNNLETNKYSLTLTYDNISKDIIGLQSKRSINNSFEKGLENFINSSKIKKIKNNDKICAKDENNKIINNEKINDNLIQQNNKEDDNSILYKENEKNNERKKEKDINSNKIKDEKKKKDNNKINGLNINNFDIFKAVNKINNLPLKCTRINSKLEELKINNKKINKKQISIGSVLNEETSNKIINNNNKIINNNKKNNNNIKSNNNNYSRNKFKRNYFKLSCQLDDKNKIYSNNFESRNSSKKENDLISLKDFITLKNTKNNNQKIFKLNNIPINNNNYILFNHEKIKSLSIEKNTKENNKLNNNNNINLKDVKIDSIKKTINQNQKKYKTNKKLSILNKFSSLFFNKNNLNKNKIKYNSEFPSPTHSILFRNDLCTKKNSSTSNKKFSSFNTIELEKNCINTKKIKNHNNLNDSNNENDLNNLLNNIKIFNNEQNIEKRNSNIISKNFLFKNYTMGKILLNNNSNKKKSLKEISVNNLKNIIYKSRNKNSTNTFHAQSVPLSQSQSKSKSKDHHDNNNLLKALNLKTNIIDSNKKIYIRNLKLQNNKYNERIIKNSKIINNSLSKCDDNKCLRNNNRNMYLTFGKNYKSGTFSPINMKQSFNFNQGIFKNRINRLNN